MSTNYLEQNERLKVLVNLLARAKQEAKGILVNLLFEQGERLKGSWSTYYSKVSTSTKARAYRSLLTEYYFELL